MATWREFWWRLPSLPAVVLSAALWGAGAGVLVGTVPLAPGEEPWSPTAAVLAGVVMALLVGIVVTLDRGADLEHAGALEGRRAREAAAASSGGPVPEDPEVREAALRMVSARLRRTVEQGRGFLVAQVVVVLSQFGLRGLASWVPWALLVGLVALVVSTVRAPRRLQRRILKLAPPPGARAASVPG